MGLLDFLSGLFGGDADETGRESEGRSDGQSEGQSDGRADGRSPDAEGDPGETSTDANESETPLDEAESNPVDEYGPADFRREAEEFAANHDDHDFDFSLSSLDALDEYTASQTDLLELVGEEMDDGSALVEEMQGGYVLWFGSYFGEVLVREFDGEWRVGGDAVEVLIRIGDQTAEVSPFDLAVASVHDDPRFAEAAAELRATRDRLEDDRDDVDAETFRTAMQTQAEELADYWSEYDLDYSPESLARLDRMVDATWEKDRFADADWDGERQVDLAYRGIVQQLGAYFGEVLVRNLDAEWTQDRGAAVAVSGPDGSAATVNVFHVADDCLTEPSKFETVYEVGREPDSLDDGDGESDGRGGTAGESDDRDV